MLVKPVRIASADSMQTTLNRNISQLVFCIKIVYLVSLAMPCHAMHLMHPQSCVPTAMLMTSWFLWSYQTPAVMKEGAT